MKPTPGCISKKRWLSSRSSLTVKLLISVCLLSLLTASLSFVHLPLKNKCGKLSSLTIATSTSATETETSTTNQSLESIPAKKSSSSSWLNKGMLLSSFTDGLKSNPMAIDWMMTALVSSLWEEEQALTQLALRESNLASPCNGPDPTLLGQLEETDSFLKREGQYRDWKGDFELLCHTKTSRMNAIMNSGGQNEESIGAIDLRILYIPTAMYALRPGSTSKPGKQRGRNRADAKKRRNEILKLFETQLQAAVSELSFEEDIGIAVHTVTMDFDDASVKQPESILVYGPEKSIKAEFPETGKQAIRQWKPHLIYVQGGNTFWLHHCMEKGDWAKDLLDACCYQEKNTEDASPDALFPAVYCGVSAGAILAGESMQTACWKEWDDPSVVPGKETYDDWTNVRGLESAGKVSIFPHMTEEWQDLTKRKTKDLIESMMDSGTAHESPQPCVYCIRDDQAYIVNGKNQMISELE